jgi:cytochrome b561
VRLRNDASGYGLVTQTLHWLTLALVLAQLAVGYLLDVDDSGAGRGRGRGRSGESGRGRGRGGSDDEGGYDVLDGTFDLLDVHVLLAVAILTVAVLRVLWRTSTPLPPWSPRLTRTDRLVLSWVERLLLALLFVIPATGLALVGGGEDLLILHVAAHVAFYITLAVHVAIVVRRRVVRRMLPG